MCCAVQDKVKVKAALRAAGVTVEPDTEWSDFLAALEAPDIQERLQCGPLHRVPSQNSHSHARSFAVVSACGSIWGSTAQQRSAQMDLRL